MGMERSQCLKTWLGGCQWGVLGSQCGLLLLGRRAGNGSTEDTVPGRPHHTDGEARVTESTGHCGGRGRTPGQKGQLWLDLPIFPSPPPPSDGLPPLGKPQWPCLLLLRGEIGTMGLGICPTLSLIPGSRFLRPTATSQNPGGGGVQRGVCVRVRVRVCLCTRTCTCVLLGSARLSVFCQAS